MESSLSDEHEVRRRDQSKSLESWIKDNLNYFHIGKLTDPYNYACAVYVCRISDPTELTDLILTKESIKK